MLISHRKQFIFTKTIKTAGTSVECYFEKFCMPEDKWEFSHSRDEYESETGIIGYRGHDATGKKWHGHMSAKKIKNLLGDEIWNNYFKFTIVRNPFDKVISNFCMVERMAGKTISDDDYRVKHFREWLNSSQLFQDYPMYIIDDQICVDFFIRYENLNEGMQDVCKQLGIRYEPEQLPRLNSFFRKDDKLGIDDYYNRESVNIIKKRYAFEIDFFGYDEPHTVSALT